MCPSLIQIGSKTAEKNSAQTNRQTDRHYENNGHLAMNQHSSFSAQACSCKFSPYGRRDKESYKRELSSPLLDLRAQVVDVCEVDAGDDDRRETVTSWFLTDEVLQTVIIILDVGTVTRLSHTHTLDEILQDKQ